MPFQPTTYTGLALNAANDTSASSFTDLRTGLPINAGGLNAGEYFDLTEDQANQLSYTTQGLLHLGRYRRVLVSSGATAANVKQGTMAFQAPGVMLQNITILTAGSGQTAGTYNLNGSGGGGTGATIQYVISAAGTLVSAVVTNPGSGYTSNPTFTIAAGGTPGTVQVQMRISANTVTSQDVAYGLNTGISVFYCGVFLNPVTPGNYGWVQEAGIATLLGASSFTGSAAVGAELLTKNSGAGTVDVQTINTALVPEVFGYAIDVPTVSVLFRGRLVLPTFPQ